MEKKTVIYNGQEVEAYDCTPTWSALLIVMLDLYTQHRVSKLSSAMHALDNVVGQFKVMASAADKYNELIKRATEQGINLDELLA